jgi:hypothetical protein
MTTEQKVMAPQCKTHFKKNHEIIGNIIITFDIYNNKDLFIKDAWSGIRCATLFALRATDHTALKATSV